MQQKKQVLENLQNNKKLKKKLNQNHKTWMLIVSN